MSEVKASTKVKLAIIDSDLTIRKLQKYPLSSTGQLIEVVSGGTEHFMPKITNTSYLNFPTRKKYYLFGKTIYEPIFFAFNKAKACFDFKNAVVDIPLPDRDQLKRANMAALAKQIGKDVNVGTPWYIWFILALNVVIFLLSLQMAGVIR